MSTDYQSSFTERLSRKLLGLCFGTVTWQQEGSHMDWTRLPQSLKIFNW